MSFLGEPKTVEFAKGLRGEERKVLAEYLHLIEEEIIAEINRILTENELIGEGRTARVFDITVPHSGVPICVKIWRQDIEKLSHVELRKIQRGSPMEEFGLQDTLYSKGFRSIPMPISITKFDNLWVLAMEKIDGYSLKEIIDAGAKIAQPHWRELENMIMRMHREYGVAHRDLTPQNIMLRTNQKLEAGAELSGELIIIDFGLSKETGGQPTEEDYILTIGDKVVRYRQDFANIDDLKPRKGNDRGPFNS